MADINMVLVIDVIIVILGVYLIYSAFMMDRKEKISTMFVHEQELVKIKDKKAFIKYIFPKVIIFSVILIIDGIVGIISETVITIPYWNWADLLIMLCAIGILMTQIRNAKEKF